MRRSQPVTREALIRVRSLLGQVDDTIYHDARRRGLVEGTQDFQYTDDEVKLSTIVDEAAAQVTQMLEAV
jgi:hypothetical protein